MRNKYNRFFKESVSKEAVEKLNSLPDGVIFDDALDISKVFKKSSIPHNKALHDFEQHEDEARVELIDIKNIRITQPNILKNKILKMLNYIRELPTIPAVKYGNEIVIFDGHHRLTAYWLLDIKQIKVNLVKAR